MTKRTYRYRQWLKFVKEQQLIDSGYYGLIPIIQKSAKDAHLYDPIEGVTITLKPGNHWNNYNGPLKNNQS